MIEKLGARRSHHWALSQRLRAMPRLTLVLLTGIAVLVLGHLLFLRTIPPVFIDEAWMASRAYAWLKTGINLGPLDSIAIGGDTSYSAFLPLLPTLLHAATIRLLGMSVTALRMLSFLFGLGLLAATYMISREIARSHRAGLITVLLILASLPFTLSSHLIRPDIFVSALGYGAIALYLLGRRRHPILFNLLSGLALGLAFEIHVNVVIYGPVILALYLMDDGWTTLRKRGFWAFAVGVGIGLGWYVWLHILSAPEAYLSMADRASETHLPPILSDSFATVGTSLYLTVMTLFLYTKARLVAALIAGIMLWRWRSTGSTKSLVMLGVGMLSFGLLIERKPDYYGILLSPFVDIVLAVWIEAMLQKRGPLPFWLKRIKAVVYMTIAATIILSLVALRDFYSPPSELTQVTSHIEQAIPPNGTVMATHTFWFGLKQHPYQTWHFLREYKVRHPGSTVGDAMAALRPDVLAIDQHMRTFLVPDEEADQPRVLPKSELDAFLVCRATLVDQLTTPAYGDVEIYAIHWDDPDVSCSRTAARP